MLLTEANGNGHNPLSNEELREQAARFMRHAG